MEELDKKLTNFNINKDLNEPDEVKNNIKKSLTQNNQNETSNEKNINYFNSGANLKDTENNNKAPTNIKDAAFTIMKMIDKNGKNNNIFNYFNNNPLPSNNEFLLDNIPSSINSSSSEKNLINIQPQMSFQNNVINIHKSRYSSDNIHKNLINYNQQDLNFNNLNQSYDIMNNTNSYFSNNNNFINKNSLFHKNNIYDLQQRNLPGTNKELNGNLNMQKRFGLGSNFNGFPIDNMSGYFNQNCYSGNNNQNFYMNNSSSYSPQINFKENQLNRQFLMGGMGNLNNDNTNNFSKNRQKKKTNSLGINLNELTVQDIINNSIILSKDQKGCRLIQKLLEDNPTVVNQIMSKINEKLIEVILDQFGNYLIQKLFEFMNEEDFLNFMSLIKQDIYKISINSYGTRVLQRLIDYLNTQKLFNNFILIIKPETKNLFIDVNGSHIILKLAEIKNKNYIKNIYSEVENNLVEISKNKHGCCVLQKFFEKIDENESNRILHLLGNNSKFLISDQCGNYIMQYIICLKNDIVNDKIVNILILDIESFSKQKFSSNVVEKCFDHCSNNSIQLLINSLLKESILINLLLDKYGNYVIQKALQKANQNIQKIILKIISPHLYKLKDLPFGPKLYSKLMTTYSFLKTITSVNGEN